MLILHRCEFLTVTLVHVHERSRLPARFAIKLQLESWANYTTKPTDSVESLCSALGKSENPNGPNTPAPHYSSRNGVPQLLKNLFIPGFLIRHFPKVCYSLVSFKVPTRKWRRQT